MFCMRSQDQARWDLAFPAWRSFFERFRVWSLSSPQSQPLVRGYRHIEHLDLHPHGWGLFLPGNPRRRERKDRRVAVVPLFEQEKPVAQRLPFEIYLDPLSLTVRPLASPDVNGARWLVLTRTGPYWKTRRFVFQVEARKSGRRVHLELRPMARLSRPPGTVLPYQVHDDRIHLAEFWDGAEGVWVEYGFLPLDASPEEEPPLVVQARYHIRPPEHLNLNFRGDQSHAGFLWPHPDTGLVAFGCLASGNSSPRARMLVIPIVQGRPCPHGFLVKPSDLWSTPQGQDDEYLYWGRFVYHIPTGRGGRIRLQKPDPQALADIVRRGGTWIAVAPDDPLQYTGVTGYHGRRLFYLVNDTQYHVWLALPTWERDGWGEVFPESLPYCQYIHPTPVARWPHAHAFSPILLGELAFPEHRFYLTSIEALRRAEGLPPDRPLDEHRFWTLTLDEIPTIPLNIEPVPVRR